MRLRVRFAETDQMGIAHHSAYVVWCEAARVEWLRERGLSYREMEEAGLSLAVSRFEAHYRAAAYFDDELELTAVLAEVRSRRVSYHYRIERDGALLATAASDHVATDRSGRATRIPELWLSPMLQLLENHP